jgi:hypothetical protein
MYTYICVVVQAHEELSALADDALHVIRVVHLYKDIFSGYAKPSINEVYCLVS